MKVEVQRSFEGVRRFTVVLEAGDEVAASLRRFAEEQGVEGASLAAIGAFEEATIAWWDWDAKAYRDHEVGGQVEVASLAGNVALDPEGGVKVHAHVVLGLPDGSARAGHLKRGVVRPTLEVFVEETSSPLRRAKDATTGLALLRP